MAQARIQTSFASGEWAPKLRSRVDIEKYHNGAALLRNFFVDYSGGGASTRQGTKFVNQALTLGARLIPFQPSSTLSFVLEFGQNYIRFHSNGAPILEATTAITGATQANPGVITDTAHGYSNGDWIFISGVGGMTQLNGNYFIVANATANTFTLTDLNGNPINTTTYGAYTSGGTAQRVYTISSPYSANDLFPNPITGNPGLKFVQNVTSLIITHPNYPPAVLTELAVTNWTLINISFLPTIQSPTGVAVASNSAAGSTTYAYIVTAVDANGQESLASSIATKGSIGQFNSSVFTNSVTWTAVPGAVSYNVYRANPVITVTFPSGAQFGFIGNVTSTTFTETSPGNTIDFSQGPPISPSTGAVVQKLTLTTNADYTVVPTVTIAAPPSGIQADANAILGVHVATPNTFNMNSFDPTQGNSPVSPVGSRINLGLGVVVTVTAASFVSGLQWLVTAISLTNPGVLSGPGTSAPGNEIPISINPPPGTSYTVQYVTGNILLTWHITGLTVTQHGSGYLTAPSVTFSPAGAAATAVLGPSIGGVSINPTGSGNPVAPGFLQQRLVLGGPPGAIQTYYMSQPGLFYNFNVSFPVQPNDAISGTIISEDLNDIRNFVSCPTGLIAFTGKTAWLINGGGGVSVNNPITPANQTANPQAFNGANDLKPIKINYDILYGTNKGNYIRDLNYNIYMSIYTGTDISILSNHLFFNHFMLDWAWSEEPFKTLWAVRDDGQLLSLAYVKEQDIIGWAHHDTDGQYMSVCSVIENVNGNIVDAVYVIAQRLVNGVIVQYVERMADRYFSYGFEDSWSVDCALQTVPAATLQGTLFITGNGSTVGNSVTLTDTADHPFTSAMAAGNWIVRANGGIYKITAFTNSGQVTASVVRVPTGYINQYTGIPFPVTAAWTIWQPVTVVSGLTQLIGKTVTGVADGAVVPPTVVSATGTITLSAAATKITLGLAFTPQLQTLPLEMPGPETVQSKRKKIAAVNIRVADTLGLSIGTSFSNLVPMKDFTIGNIGTQSNQQVTGLVNGDGRTIIDQAWAEAGNYCIQQNQPFPATILGVMPEVMVGDMPK